ncbi:MAG: hypothetical protein ACJ714_11790 [Ornithinibacter sp.]
MRRNPGPSRRTLRAPVVALLLTIGALLAAPAGAGATPQRAAPASAADEQALAEKYAPVVRLVTQAEDCGPGEPFLPTDVDRLLGNDTVALRGPWTTDDLVKIAPTADDLGKGLSGYHLDFPGSPLNPGCSYEQWADEETAGSAPTTYARVVSEQGRPGLAVQYWLYYPFNDFNNKHESDWEMIQVEFAASDAATALQQQPTRVGYSQHEGVEIATWGDTKLEVVDGTHPVVHPAAGSHANYYDAALFLGRSGQQGFGCDDSRGPTTDARPEVALVPSDPTAVGAAYPWLDYTGRWGQREASFYNGPTGPNTKDQWTEPLTWTDTEGAAAAYAVPASGLYGTQATSSFCSIVATGSDALRLAMNNLAIAAAALLAVGLVIAWLVRRTTWRPSAPLRLVRRRSTGQVIAAVWRMYLGQMLLFIGIGVPIAVATTLPGVATAWVTSVGQSLTGNPTLGGILVLVAGLVLASLSPITLALGQAATMAAARAIDEGRPTGPLRAYRASLRRAVPLLLTGLAVVVVAVLLALTVVLIPVALVLVVLSLLITPVVLFEQLSGWRAVKRSAHLVRRNWVKVLVLVALTNGLVLAIGPLLGTALILGTSLPFAVSNAIAGIVYALFIPLVALNTVYVYADIVVRDELEPREAKAPELPAEASLA